MLHRLIFPIALIICVAGAGSNVVAQQNGSAALGCVVILGAVQTPMKAELRRPVKLAELIASAGGVTERAGRTVSIVHGSYTQSCNESSLELQSGKPDVIFLSLADVNRGVVESNPLLRGGDVIVVAEADLVYVVGAVEAPQSLVLNPKLTVLQAVAMAGGVVKGAAPEKTKLFRQSPGTTTTALKSVVDLKAIKKGRAADPELQPNDVVDVPLKRGDGLSGPCCGLIKTDSLPIHVIE